MIKQLFFIGLLSISFGSCAQLGDLNLDKAAEKLSEISSETQDGDKGGLSNEDVIAGLKEALSKGATESVGIASAVDGFYKKPEIFIPIPEEAEKAVTYARKMGLNKQVDNFEMNLNRAAELASKEAKPVLLAAVRNMSISDAMGLLKGSDTAATHYLRKTCNDSLYAIFKPIVQEKIAEVKLTSYWNPIASAYNKSVRFTGGEKMNPDLEDYVTKKALNGLYYLIAQEEQKIRKDPLARTTEILKKVFGNL